MLEFDEATVVAKTQEEIDAGTDVESILNDGLISAMDKVGEKFSSGELFVPEMLMAAQAMKVRLVPTVTVPTLLGRWKQHAG